MSRKYLRDVSGCGTKIIKYWDEFFYRIDTITLNGNTVSDLLQNGDYELEVSWIFNSQIGRMSIKFKITGNSIIYDNSSLIDTSSNNHKVHKFQRPLGLYQDSTLNKVFNRIIIR